MSSDLKRYICDAIAEHDDIAQQALRDQWKQLIFRPLLMLGNSSFRSSILVILIDALDECEREIDIRVILQLLAQTKDLDTVQLRVFITSRPESLIRFSFRAIPGDVR